MNKIRYVKGELLSTEARLKYGIENPIYSIIRLTGLFLGIIKYFIVGNGYSSLNKFYDDKIALKVFNKYFDSKNKVFDFNGLKFPDFDGIKSYAIGGLINMSYFDIILPHLATNKKYETKAISKMQYIGDGPYMMTDASIKLDFIIKPGDVVIDAGAWAGAFSLIASDLGATSFAFEPSEETYKYLCRTAELNNGRFIGKIVPVMKGIGDKDERIGFDSNTDGNGGNVVNTNNTENSIELTSIDSFVKENNLSKVDFIKSDIEGYEKNLIIGAKDTIAKFKPKLSISTYHLPDDEEVISKLILDIDPSYKIKYMHKKLFAYIAN